MVHPLGRLDQAGDELDRADEVAALEALRDRLAGALPAGELGQPRLDLGIAQQRHRAYAGRRAMAAQSSDRSRPSGRSTSRTTARRRAGRSTTRSRPRPPLAAAGSAHPDRPLAHPRRAADPPGAADRRRARSATRPRSSPRWRRATRSRRSTPPTPDERRRALELEDFFDEELGPHARLLPFHELIKEPERLRRGRRRAAVPGPLGKAKPRGRRLRPRLHQPALRRQQRRGRGSGRARRSSPPSTGSRPSWSRATASSWSATASASPTSPPPRSSTRWSSRPRARSPPTRPRPPPSSASATSSATAPATAGSKRPSAATAIRPGRAPASASL